MSESTYTGAPDECSYCFVWGTGIVKLDDNGNCPNESEHATFGPKNWM